MIAPKKVRKRTVTVDKQNDKIRLRFSYQAKRYRISTGLDYNETNLILIERISKIIIQDIVGNKVDTTLESYRRMMFSEKNNVHSGNATAPEPKAVSLYATFMRWIDHKIKRREIKSDPIPSSYHFTGKLLQSWGDIAPENVPERLWSMDYKPTSYNDKLGCLRNFFEWCVSKEIFPENPLKDSVRRKDNPLLNKNRQPFTEKELHRIIHAFESDQFCTNQSGFKHSHHIHLIDKPKALPGL